MLGSPEITAYDLRFRLLNIPVRVHPLFWLIMLFISGLADIDLKLALVFVACAFFSILVHEFGHGLSARHGRRAHGDCPLLDGRLLRLSSEQIDPLAADLRFDRRARSWVRALWAGPRVQLVF